LVFVIVGCDSCLRAECGGDFTKSGGFSAVTALRVRQPMVKPATMSPLAKIIGCDCIFIVNNIKYNYIYLFIFCAPQAAIKSPQIVVGSLPKLDTEFQKSHHCNYGYFF
jgi:hypothetical protein